ncbi:hypothetical protein Lpp41_15106, partial [Lacticaseibacillus paracasei subsp. paracasei Lpp41]
VTATTPMAVMSNGFQRTLRSRFGLAADFISKRLFVAVFEFLSLEFFAAVLLLKEVPVFIFTSECPQ